MSKTKYLTAVFVMAVAIFGALHYLGSYLLARPTVEEVETSVAKSVYRITNGSGGYGSAFVVVLTDKKNIFITNAHVCESSINNFMWLGAIPLRIMKIYDQHDLCALESPVNPNYPLTLAEDYYTNEHIYAVGFPLIPYLTVREGTFKGLDQLYMLAPNTPKNLCVGRLKWNGACSFSGVVQTTTVTSDFGGSGSPILNVDLEVVGVVMAIQGASASAMGVPLGTLRLFLEGLNK